MEFLDEIQSEGMVVMENGTPVALTRCTSYEEAEIRQCLVKMFADLALPRELFAGKRICLKPNLVMAKKPELGATTHPTVLAALAKLLLEQGARRFSLRTVPEAPMQQRIWKLCTAPAD